MCQSFYNQWNNATVSLHISTPVNQEFMGCSLKFPTDFSLKEKTNKGCFFLHFFLVRDEETWPEL